MAVGIRNIISALYAQFVESIIYVVSVIICTWPRKRVTSLFMAVVYDIFQELLFIRLSFNTCVMNSKPALYEQYSLSESSRL